ncbi:hypothetical protein [Psychroflexus tropicus]|uniref:hypothetical protein n=1 Tax=Psychroflexus tropicus TaxID=197345 RepID=UPI00036E6791|nr:hypothetical protein [Psychroflexus tropicus]
MIKPKVVLSSILLTVLVVITIITKNESEHAERYIVLNDVGSLTFKDFFGVPDLLSDYNASIATTIKIKKIKDSIYAETIFDRYQSWVDFGILESDDLLVHEHYHAHITDYGTNALNNLILKKGLSFSEAKYARDSLLSVVNLLQSNYDKETKHNLDRESQIYWEYKIDSLNQVAKRNQNEELSFDGAEVFFSSLPTHEFHLYPDMINSSLYTSQNNIRLEIITIYDYVYSTNANDYENPNNESNINVIKIDSLLIDGLKALKITSIDSTESKESVDVFIPNNDRTYQIITSYPKNDVYRKISENFIKSFKIDSDLKFWINYYESEINKDPWIANPDNSNNKNEILHFTKNTESDYAVIYSKAFEYDKKLLIPFKPLRHEKEDIMQILAIVNGEIKISNEIDSLYQMIPIELSKLKKGSNHIQIGYIPKEKDSIRDFNHFYSTHIYYDK